MGFTMRLFDWQARLERQGVRVLATVPVAQSGKVPVPPDEPFLEGVRFLRAALQTLPDGRSARVVLMAPVWDASCAGDLARYLARSFAEAGKKAVLLPLDDTAARSGQTGPGASDFLAGPDMGFGDIVSETWDRVEMVRPGGTPLADASPDRVRDLLGQASEKAESVIVFAGQEILRLRPLFLALAANSDGVVLVADASQAEVKEMRNAAKEIGRDGGRVLGVALCRRRK